MMVLYLVSTKSPTRVLRMFEAELIQGKWTWAVDHRGRRHLVGTTAFYTYSAACRAKAGGMLRLAKEPSNRWNFMRKDEAARQLAKFPTHQFPVYSFTVRP